MLASLLLASCTSTSDPLVQFGLAPQADLAADDRPPNSEFLPDEAEAEAAYALLEQGDAAPGDEIKLPATVAAVPSANPAAPPAGGAAANGAASEFPEAPPATAENGETRVAAASPSPPTEAQPREKRGFFASFFSADETEEPKRETWSDAQPALNLASLAPTGEARSASEPSRSRPEPEPPADVNPDRRNLYGDPLPGVRTTALFEIRRRSGRDDDSDIDLHESGGAYQVASAGGLARLAPNGLAVQHKGVDTACLKPSLVRVLKTIERHFGSRVVVTSGFRDAERNRRARGARNSQHMKCAAADIQVAGVSKWDLAEFARSMRGRGGVGTYCHTNSIHVDVGPERDWNWRCRRGD